MKKGFTLIELLAVIVILALIAAIGYPIVSGNIKAAKESASKSQKELIVNAAKYWVSENDHLLSDTVGDIYTLPISTLKNEKYLSANVIKDIESNGSLENGCVKIKTEAHKYIYTFSMECE